ncbi:trypsin-like peptidase domain-containing protein [Halobacillus salinarum]|uniref:trypsin-like peptidase domain-containing protein n=1 Tax=Halobacillus salinarum TaxID=2932257 RepID=UPI002961EBBC|nr:trypsin-like peptidase domain-containing protein [Halobacillus salinarum]
MKDRKDKDDIIDEDLYEEIDEEELYELVQKEKEKAWERARARERRASSKRPFPKWAFWLIAVVMVLNLLAVLPATFSIPAIDFLKTSAQLSANKQIDEYQRSIVVVEAGESKGTGFSFTADGKILTNHHVIEGEKRISVAFKEQGLFQAEVIGDYPEIDLAVLDVKEDELPHLALAEKTAFKEGNISIL